MKRIHIIGGGLAGPEAALQAAHLTAGTDIQVILSEMRPVRSTEAHQTADFAELVCSNSLKSETENSAPWLLKQEMRRAGSFLLQAADATAVPAGNALAVDRTEFSQRVADLLAAEPRIEIRREEVTHLDEHDPDTITVLASGPLTSSSLAQELQRLTGADHLAFYDSISPIVDASTIDMEKVYLAARWDKGTADYINCPFTKDEYDRFLDALMTAERVEPKAWEHIPFAACSNDLGSDLSNTLSSRPEAEQSSAVVERPPHFGHPNLNTHVPGDPDPNTLGQDDPEPNTLGPGHPEPNTLGQDDSDPSLSGCHPAAQRRDLLSSTAPQLPGAPSSPTASPSVRLGSANANPTTDPTPQKLNYFEACLPIEELARRGRDTLRFGPMKPAGLTNPKTGRWPYACVQLRQENLRADSYNLVGFQNHLKFGEQARVLRLIPGLENARFLRYGQIHRNTYLNAPTLLTETLQLRAHPRILVAGQLSGVEGYTESIAGGLLAGRFAAALALGQQPTPAPRLSAHGSLTHYITHAEAKRFQPANVTFDLLPPLEEELRKRIRDKKERHRLQCERALEAWQHWLAPALTYA